MFHLLCLQVLAGFIMAVACILIVDQIPLLLGLPCEVPRALVHP